MSFNYLFDGKKVGETPTTRAKVPRSKGLTLHPSVISRRVRILASGGKSSEADTPRNYGAWPVVVVLPPFFHCFTDLMQVVEPVLIQAFILNLAVAIFDGGVLGRFTRSNEV